MKTNFFVGCYTEMITGDFGGSGDGISSMQLNEDTGEVELLGITPSLNPSYLAISDDGKYLYTSNEVVTQKEPKVEAYKILENGSLQFLNSLTIAGSLPCHITYFNKCLFVACYGTGNLLSFSIAENGEILRKPQYFQHSGSSLNQERQKEPHAHQTVVHPNGNTLFVPDLGIDLLKVYTIKDKVLVANPINDVPLLKGGGPRHMVFHKNGSLGYVMNELTGGISVIERAGEQFFLKNTYNSLPESYADVPSGSAIRMHPNGKFLYVGNRGLDVITVFKIVKSELIPLGYEYTHGTTLREFNITPNGKWLMACLQDSNEIVIYTIAPNGELIEKSRNKTILSPVCIAFL